MEDFRAKSFWLSQGDYDPRPPLQGEVKADVVVLGGGFTGLATAWFLKEAEPALDVVVVEQEVVGFGASGRNAGFSMTLFGMTLGLTALRFGRQAAAEAHQYMERAVDLVQRLVSEHDLDSDYEHTGFLRVATSEKYEKRIREELNLAHQLGISGIEWLEGDRLAEEVRSPMYRGAWWEPRTGLLNPARHARALARLVEARGVRIFDGTPVTRIERPRGAVVLHTSKGKVTAEKAALATNAWSHFVPGLKRKQVPVFTHVVLTEPLAPRHFEAIGWQNRQGIEDARNLVHYYRLTKDGRLLMGGRDVSLAFGGRMDRDENPATFRALEADIHRVFPALSDLAITHRWGGPVSVTMDFAPALGFVGDERTVYSLGCMGHGVSLTHMNGWTLADLLLGRRTERTDVFFVNRKTLPWPPEPVRFALAQSIKAYLDVEDRLFDRSPRGDGEKM